MLPNGIDISGIDTIIVEELEETGNTLEENALQKARFVALKTGRASFADDTGLEIEALGGAPGVLSARYAGPDKSAIANMEKVLHGLQNFQSRKAQFRTVIAFVNGEKETLFEGIIKGAITHSPLGEMGFGYDPIFVPEGEQKTFAQMTLDEKNLLSHRARAFQKFVTYLRTENFEST